MNEEIEMIEESLIAPCGMYCALCQAYQGKGLKCNGCGKDSERKSCRQCSIRLCNEKKNYCFECSHYPCARLKHLDQRYRERYNMSMLENLRILKEKGVQEFLRQQEDKYRCDQCGKLKTVHQDDCLHCKLQKNRKSETLQRDSLLLRKYQTLLQETQMIESYQAFLRLFHRIHQSLMKEIPNFQFQKQVIENGMNYSYFQLSDAQLKQCGLKIVVVFLHKECRFEVWLSGYNRKHQKYYHSMLQTLSFDYSFSVDPNHQDYILKVCLPDSLSCLQEDQLILRIKEVIQKMEMDIMPMIDHWNIQ